MFKQNMHALDSLKVTPRANGEAGIFRQAPLILNDYYHAIMEPRNSSDYFDPHVRNNPIKILCNTEVNSKLIETPTRSKSKSTKKPSQKPIEESPENKMRPRRKREMRDLARMQKWLREIQNIRGNYWRNFLYITGRVNPWPNMLLLLIWTTIVLVLHKEYGGLKLLGHDMTIEINGKALHYLGVALGYLLYMQASVSSKRWWQGRIEWQMLMNKNKQLAIDLNTKLRFAKLTKFGCKLIVAHTITVWCFLQDQDWDGWIRELKNVLRTETITRIMRISRRLRPMAILYAFQRMIEVSISEGILQREAARDINPMLVSLSNSFDACNRSRIAQFPFIMAVHLMSVVFIYLALLPLSLVVDYSEYNKMEIVQYHCKAKVIYAYAILVSYSFFGLYEMAVVIEDPFSYKKEHHSFGFWGLWEHWIAIQISDIRDIFGFHVDEITTEKKNSCGSYGEKWSVEKFDSLILRAAEMGILENSEKVKANIAINSPDKSFFELFSEETQDVSSDVPWPTASDDDEHDINEAKVPNNIRWSYEQYSEGKKFTPSCSSTFMLIAPVPEI